ncbi:MAG: hypothetical protein H0T65_22690, partial [Deltaproteobacteria bacterium]|nr:hypothetical protein [Deltaproteobacteria bacterium]
MSILRSPLTWLAVGLAAAVGFLVFSLREGPEATTPSGEGPGAANRSSRDASSNTNNA